MEEVMRVELDIPVNTYKALEYICNLPPKEDVKSYMIRALYMDAESVADSGFPDQVYYLSDELKKILNS